MGTMSSFPKGLAHDFQDIMFNNALNEKRGLSRQQKCHFKIVEQRPVFLRGTGVFFAWACATAEQAMCMEAHHRVCLHQNGASQSYHSDYFARWSWRMCSWFNKMCSLQKKL